MAEAHLLIPEKLAGVFSEFAKALAREMRDTGVGTLVK